MMRMKHCRNITTKKEKDVMGMSTKEGQTVNYLPQNLID